MAKIRICDLFDIEKGTLQSSKNVSGQYDFVTASSEWKTHESYSHECEALIFAMGASGSLGRTHYVNGKFITSDLCFILTPKEKYRNIIELKLYYYYFNFNREHIVKATATGTSKKAINLGNFSNYEIDFVENQKEILNKIETAMPLSDEIKQLNFRNRHLINEAKALIIDKAVTGKLRTQSQSDLDANAIIEEIESERTSNKIKKEKSIKPIDEENNLIKLPQKWKWIRFGEIIKNSRYGTSKKTDYKTAGVAVLRIPNVSKGILELEDIKYGDLTEKEKNDLSLNYHDMLLVRSNGSSKIVGKSVLIEQDMEGYAFAGYLVRVELFKEQVYPPYIDLVLNSNLVRNQIEPNLRTTTGVKNINTKEIHNILMTLPPLNEQKRIVKKVNELMKHVEELDFMLSKTEIEANNVIPVILNEVF